MPCWYLDKKEIRNSPSYQDNIDQVTENRYRREGARLILDAGTKLGLRYDTCATGVVYFHRFYMAHSFREFHRYVMSACCLFLAGKVEETPKKCRDIIRTVQTLLSADAFAAFGDDPREEVMTMERILLQTIKFDLQVEHPYSFLLSYAKQIKGDKDKIQKMAQMSWTFINDSLCTTLCLQWEPEIISVSLMYLASRLTKFEPTDWTGRISGSKSKWWEDLINGLTMELMEDICHQVLDLYSAQQQAQKQEKRDVSPPIAAGPRGARPNISSGPRDTPPPPPGDPPPAPKRMRMVESPADPLVGGSKAKKIKHEREGAPASKQSTPAPKSAPSSKTSSPNMKIGPSGGSGRGHVSAAPINPYVSSSMYSSSFMSQEGQQSIQSLLGGTPSTPQPPPQQYPNYPPPSTPGQYPPPPGPYTPGSYSAPGASVGYAPTPGQYHTPPPPYTGSYNAPPYGQGAQATYSSAALPNPATPSTAYQPPPAPYSAPPPNIPPPGQGYHYPPLMGQPPPAGPPPPFPPPGYGAPPPGGYNAPPPMMPPRARGSRPNQSNLAPVRCVSDRGGMR